VGFIFSFALNLELIKSDPENDIFISSDPRLGMLLGSLIAFFPAPRSSTSPAEHSANFLRYQAWRSFWFRSSSILVKLSFLSCGPAAMSGCGNHNFGQRF